MKKGVLKPDYSFAFLGDLHFDRSVHHDMEWVKENHPGDVRQIKDYCLTTEQYTKGVLTSASAVLQRQVSPFAFIQVGDFVEGLCGSGELQTLQFKDAIRFVKSVESRVPFLIAKGNHDITGPGADQAYSDVIIPWMNKQLGGDVKGPSFFMEHCGDLFVFFDAYRPDLNWLENVLKKNPARHLFFVVHEPVVPYNARSEWYLFSRDKTVERRDRLLNLLGEHHAVVLCGHLHHYSVLRRKTDKGPLVQLSLSSVIRSDDSPVNLIEGIDRYTPDLIELEPDFGKGSEETRKAVLKAEQPFIEYFEMARVPGFGIIRSFDDRVEFNVYLRNSQDVWRRLEINRGTLEIRQKLE